MVYTRKYGNYMFDDRHVPDIADILVALKYILAAQFSATNIL